MTRTSAIAGCKDTQILLACAAGPQEAQAIFAAIQANRRRARKY
jgi:hypothetical protein